MAPENSPGAPPGRALAQLDVAVAALLTLSGAALSIAMPRLVATGGMREAQEFINLSPVFFPRLAFGVMAVLALIQLNRAIRRLPGAAPSTGEGWVAKYQNPIVAAALVIIYAYLIPWLGFSAAGFAGIAAITVAIGSRSWREILPVALLSPLAVRFVFERLLLISLPRSQFDLIARPEEALMQFLVRLFFLRF
jgi:hypothetical protein